MMLFAANLPTNAHPERVPVAKNKGSIEILCIGEHNIPFFKTFNRVKNDPKRNNGKEIKQKVPVAIPHGFSCRTLCSGRLWIFETKVTPQSAHYKCWWENKPDHASEWCTSPSAAYKKVNELLISLGFPTVKYDANENGALLVGVTYASVQEVIEKHMPDEYAKFLESLVVGGITKPPQPLIKRLRMIKDEEEEFQDAFTSVERAILNIPLSASDVVWLQDELDCCHVDEASVVDVTSFEDDELLQEDELKIIAEWFQVNVDDQIQPLIWEEEELAQEYEPLPGILDIHDDMRKE